MLACLVVFCVALPGVAEAQSKRYRPPARYIQFREPNQAEGRKIIEDFRKQGISGDYYLEFNLRIMPRRGDTQVVTGGRLWGSRNPAGPISRVELPAVESSPARRLLVQNGTQGSVWVAPVGNVTAKAGVLDASALFAPLAGTDLTAFDLQMPFLYWNDFVYEGMAPVGSRPAHVFLMYPPADITALKPELAGVRVYLDTQFGALVQSQQIGAEERVLKTMVVLDIKKVDDQWMVKAIDIRNDATRNKTQFVVTGVALKLDFMGMLFEPSNLAEPVSPPEPARIHRLGQ